MREKTRRDFIKISGLTAAASLVSFNSSKAKMSGKKRKLKLGLASYSLRNFNQDQAIAMAKRAGLDYMCFKSMHLPLDASDSEIENGSINVKNAGLTLYGGGVIYMKNKKEVDQAF